MSTQAISAVDKDALHQLISVEPQWCGIGKAGDLTSCPPNVLLHAGPPFNNVEEICKPILNSAFVAAVYEGLASDFRRAQAAIEAGGIKLEPAQDYNVVTPLASVVSYSMPLQIVQDGNNEKTQSFAPINGGSGPAMRLGLCNDDVLTHLQWLNGDFAQIFGNELSQPIDLLTIAREAIKQGDDCHGRTPAATKLLSEQLHDCFDLPTEASVFLESGPSFFLNLWMAACKCTLNAASGIQGSSLVVSAGANGVETGIQTAGLPGRWFTSPAEIPKGKFDVDVPPSRGLGAIGDSAIVDTLGFGAMAMNYAPEQQKGLLEFMPADGLQLPGTLLSIEHPGFKDLKLRVGLLARTVVDFALQPVVSLGVLDNEGELGRLGGGIFIQPKSVFDNAISEGIKA